MVDFSHSKWLVSVPLAPHCMSRLGLSKMQFNHVIETGPKSIRPYEIRSSFREYWYTKYIRPIYTFNIYVTYFSSIPTARPFSYQVYYLGVMNREWRVVRFARRLDPTVLTAW